MAVVGVSQKTKAQKARLTVVGLRLTTSCQESYSFNSKKKCQKTRGIALGSTDRFFCSLPDGPYGLTDMRMGGDFLHLWPSGDIRFFCRVVNDVATMPSVMSFYDFHPFAVHFCSAHLLRFLNIFLYEVYFALCSISTCQTFEWRLMSSPHLTLIHTPRFYADCMLSVKVNTTSKATDSKSGAS